MSKNTILSYTPTLNGWKKIYLKMLPSKGEKNTQPDVNEQINMHLLNETMQTDNCVQMTNS